MIARAVLQSPGDRRSCVWLLVLMCWLTPAIAQSVIRIEFSRSVVQFVDGRILPGDVQTEFDCSERIYGTFMISGLGIGQQVLQTRWRSPRGKIERINSRRINVKDEDRVIYLSSSIEFRGESGLLALMDPSAGFESYLGTWTVEAINHGQSIGLGSFTVLC